MLFEKAADRDELDATVLDELVVLQRVANENDLLRTQVVLAQNVFDLLAFREARPVAEALGEQAIDARAFRMLSDKRFPGTAADEPLDASLFEEPQNRDDLVE